MRVMRVVSGMLLLLLAVPVICAGAFAWWAMQHRSPDGSFHAQLAPVQVPGRVLVVPDVDALLRRDAPFTRAADARLSITADQDVFLAVGRPQDVATYLAGTGYTEVIQASLGRGPLIVRTRYFSGTGEQLTPPDGQTVWLRQGQGDLTWTPAIDRGQPLALVIVAPEGATQLRLAASVSVAWLGTTTWGLLILGPVLLLLGLGLLAWPQRTRELVYVVGATGSLPPPVPAQTVHLRQPTQPAIPANAGVPHSGPHATATAGAPYSGPHASAAAGAPHSGPHASAAAGAPYSGPNSGVPQGGPFAGAPNGGPFIPGPSGLGGGGSMANTGPFTGRPARGTGSAAAGRPNAGSFPAGAPAGPLSASAGSFGAPAGSVGTDPLAGGAAAGGYTPIDAAGVPVAGGVTAGGDGSGGVAGIPQVGGAAAGESGADDAAAGVPVAGGRPPGRSLRAPGDEDTVDMRAVAGLAWPPAEVEAKTLPPVEVPTAELPTLPADIPLPYSGLRLTGRQGS